MSERFLIPEPTATDRFESMDIGGDPYTFPVYVNERGEDLKWGGKFPLPKVGSRVYVTMNKIGWAEVVGYFESHGFLGVMTFPENPPEWLRNQVKRHANDGPEWAREGIGCEFGIEIALTKPERKGK